MSTTYTLVEGDQQATVSSTGGHIVSYSVGGKDILAGHENPAKPAFRGALLAPWPNRVAAGRWSWQGTENQLTINDPQAGAALHGLVYDVEWSVVSTSPGAVSLAYDLAPSSGYPFPLHLEVTYALSAPVSAAR